MGIHWEAHKTLPDSLVGWGGNIPPIITPLKPKNSTVGPPAKYTSYMPIVWWLQLHNCKQHLLLHVAGLTTTHWRPDVVHELHIVHHCCSPNNSIIAVLGVHITYMPKNMKGQDITECHMQLHYPYIKRNVSLPCCAVNSRCLEAAANTRASPFAGQPC